MAVSLSLHVSGVAKCPAGALAESNDIRVRMPVEQTHHIKNRMQLHTNMTAFGSKSSIDHEKESRAQHKATT